MPAVQIELFQQYNPDGEPNEDEVNPVTMNGETESLIETMDFGDEICVECEHNL